MSLSPKRWARVQEMFHAALERPDGTRASYVADACGDDTELLEEVMSLLEAHEHDAPITEVVGAQAGIFDRLAAALVGRYTVERELGSGGMATVFLADEMKHNRKVAIKVLRPELSATLGADRFLREIEIAAGLQHPHILPLYDSGSADGLLYYVMPYVEGNTLWDRLARGGPLNQREALQVGADVLSALEYAHQRNVIHRDIKPANILLSASGGHAVVADFGIAHAVNAAGGGEHLTLTGAPLGTPGYMPPEQMSGNPVTPATDVFAAGVLLYECLTGRRWEFAADPQTAVWTGVPSNIQPVIRRALAWAPEKRWQTASAFRQALLGTERPPIGWRRTVGVAAVTVVGLLGIGLGGWAVVVRGSSSAAAPASVTRLAVLPFTVRGSGEFSYLGEGMVNLLSTGLDGAGSWRSVDPRAVFSMVSNEGVPVDLIGGRRIAQRLDADLYVLGNIVEVGGRGLSITASLYREDGGADPIVKASVSGEPTEVFALVDDMAAQLLAGESGASDARLTQIALVTTRSLPALKSYLRGIRALRGSDYQEAADDFYEAIAADSAFALAWYQLSVTADWLLQADVGRDAAEKAVRFADRLSERDRRLLVAMRTGRSGDATEAERLYRGIIGTYPNDVEAWSQLGEILMHFSAYRGFDLEQSREAWERLVALEPDRGGAYVHLARLEASERNLDALDAMAGRVLELAPEGDRALEMRTLQAFSRDDRAAQDLVVVELGSANDDAVAEAAWSASAFIGDPAATERIVRVMIQEPRSVEMRALGYEWLSYNHIAQGHWNRALEELDAMGPIDLVRELETRTLLLVALGLPVDSNALLASRARLLELDGTAVPRSAARGVWFAAHDGLHEHFRLYLLGHVSAALGDEADAMARSDELEDLGSPDGSGSLIADLVRGVRATVAWRAGRIDEAIEQLDALQLEIWHLFASSSAFYSQVNERYLRARALESVGRFDDALRWYGSFDDAGVQAMIFGPLSHWRRGHVYEQMGDDEAARRSYQRSLSLWVDPDPVFRPMADDARQRLAALSDGPN